MNIESIDLNLLVAFDAMMQERNVTRAGLRVGLSQPSMSHALTRLRSFCGDPLFVRVKTGMEPTPFAQRIAPSVRAGLAIMRAGLEEAVAFDPARSERIFQILLSDIGEVVYLPRLMQHLKKVARVSGCAYCNCRAKAIVKRSNPGMPTSRWDFCPD